VLSKRNWRLDGSMTISHTFVVPAYGDNPFLLACLQSLKAQTLPSRIVIATSTPCAAIREAAAAMGVDVVINPERRGIGADWNFALAQAATRHVTLAHQDDEYLPNFLDTTAALFARNPRAAMTFTGFQQISDNGTPRSSRVSVVKDMLLGTFAGRSETVAGMRGRLLLSFGNPISCSSASFDCEKLLGFQFSETLASNLDWHAWLTLIERGDTLAYSSDRLVRRRYNEQTETSRLIKDGRRRAEDQMMFDQLWPKPVSRLLGRAYAQGY
jgi:cellulose synthase/poly-beta-1,6-N-acetylglucosamine synthase-like glycosyltransferase